MRKQYLSLEKNTKSWGTDRQKTFFCCTIKCSCSRSLAGLKRLPVTEEIVGSNPIGCALHRSRKATYSLNKQIDYGCSFFMTFREDTVSGWLLDRWAAACIVRPYSAWRSSPLLFHIRLTWCACIHTCSVHYASAEYVRGRDLQLLTSYMILCIIFHRII